MKTDTLYTSFIGGAMAWLGYIIGGIDHLIKALVLFMHDYRLRTRLYVV